MSIQSKSPVEFVEAPVGVEEEGPRNFSKSHLGRILSGELILN